MLEYILDDKGDLIAVVDFWIVNPDGTLNNRGDNIFINDFYVNPAHRGNGMVAEFTKRIIERVPWAKYAYFERRKYDYRLEGFDKSKWLRIAAKSIKKEIEV